jgi:hypothetical protein
MTPDRFPLRLALFLGLALLSACSDSLQPKAATPDDPFLGLKPGLQPVLVVTEAGPATTYAEVRLHRVQNSSPIASFQAELAYDTAQLSVLGGDFAPNVDGAWHEVSPGRVRFAGATAVGLGDAPLATLRFSSRYVSGKRAFGLDVQEIVGADDFRDLTSLVASGSPIVVAAYPTR